MSKRKVLCPGTYDPVTNGHRDAILRVAELFDEVIVAVAENCAKTNAFTADERTDMCRRVFADAKNIRVVKCEGLVTELYKKEGCCAIVKGVRDNADCTYEAELADINRNMGGCTTLLMPTDDKYKFLSSTVVREFGKYGADISKIVPECILNDIERRLNNKEK